MAKKIFLFIVLIRAFAAIVITNAHYTGVYPTDIIANGGLLGDVLFFSVSGFCLANTQGNFGKWYLKRFIRVYTPTWLITICYTILGAYVVKEWKDLIEFFIWPTHWHFVASIILLYIPLFFISKYIEINTKNFWCLTIALFIIQLFVYLNFYNYDYYHIDNVREPMIEFLFFQAMLLGLYFRWKSQQDNNVHKSLNVIRIGGGHFVVHNIFCQQDCICKNSLFSRISDNKSSYLVDISLCAIWLIYEIRT